MQPSQHTQAASTLRTREQRAPCSSTPIVACTHQCDASSSGPLYCSDISASSADLPSPCSPCNTKVRCTCAAVSARRSKRLTHHRLLLKPRLQCWLQLHRGARAGDILQVRISDVVRPRQLQLRGEQVEHLVLGGWKIVAHLELRQLLEESPFRLPTHTTQRSLSDPHTDLRLPVVARARKHSQAIVNQMTPLECQD